MCGYFKKDERHNTALVLFPLAITNISFNALIGDHEVVLKAEGVYDYIISASD